MVHFQLRPGLVYSHAEAKAYAQKAMSEVERDVGLAFNSGVTVDYSTPDGLKATAFFRWENQRIRAEA